MKNFLADELERVNKLIVKTQEDIDEYFSLLKENFLYYHKSVLYSLYKSQHLITEYKRQKEELETLNIEIGDETMGNIETIKDGIEKYVNFCQSQVRECERKLLYTTPGTTTNEFVNLNEKFMIEVNQELRKYYNICINRSTKYFVSLWL